MQRYYHFIYVLVLSICIIVILGCNKDDSPPQITDIIPTEGSVLQGGETYNFQFEFSDDEGLSRYEVDFYINDNAIVIERTGSLSGKEDFFVESISLPENFEHIHFTIRIFDINDNSHSRELLFEGPEKGRLNLIFRLRYDSQPLVMLDSYIYPDGKKMNFTRFSMYISEVTVYANGISQPVTIVDFLNLTNDHLSVDAANQGRDYMITGIEPGNYDSLSFKIGVNPQLNTMVPADFPSGHPLANPAEHWFSWNSYIFTKVEGNIDLNDDGMTESPVALHLGSDSALVHIGLEKSFVIEINQTENIPVDIDLYHLFTGDMGIYDIGANSQIHSLSQIDQVIELTNNLKTIFN